MRAVPLCGPQRQAVDLPIREEALQTGPATLAQLGSKLLVLLLKFLQCVSASCGDAAACLIFGTCCAVEARAHGPGCQYQQNSARPKRLLAHAASGKGQPGTPIMPAGRRHSRVVANGQGTGCNEPGIRSKWYFAPHQSKAASVKLTTNIRTAGTLSPKPESLRIRNISVRQGAFETVGHARRTHAKLASS